MPTGRAANEPAPFRRGPFSELPEHPRLPHPYGEASKHFIGELERRRDQGQGFPTPLMLIYARQDPMVPPEMGPKLHHLIPDAKFHWLENSSHFAQVDSPAPLAELATGFLRTDDATGA